MERVFGFDDVLLVPKPSEVISRDDVDLSVTLGNLSLDIPIIASPMKGIVGVELIDELRILGGIGILHRFYNRKIDWINNLIRSTSPYGVAIGLGDKKYHKALDCDANIICIDVANGYTKSLLSFVEEVSDYITSYGYETLLMAGSICTGLGAVNLINSGVNLLRVGVGSGSLCSTRQVTGVGIPQISAIQEVSDAIESMESYPENVYIVADGGIRHSGDAVKAIAAGADVVMMGSLFAQAKESSNSGLIRGMASREFQEEYYHTVKSVEGIEKIAKKTRSLEDFISEFTYGMKSACTYLGANNLQNLQLYAEFVRIN